MFETLRAQKIEGFKVEKVARGICGYRPIATQDQAMFSMMNGAQFHGEVTLPSGAKLPNPQQINGDGSSWRIDESGVAIAAR